VSGENKEGEGGIRRMTTDKGHAAVGRIYSVDTTYQFSNTQVALQVTDDQGKTRVIHVNLTEGNVQAYDTDPDAIG
jgi:hypothetical protein